MDPKNQTLEASEQSWRGFRAQLREGILRLDGLDRGVQVLAVAGVLVIAVASGLILLRRFDLELPGGAVDVESVGVVPRLVIAFAYVGLAVAAAAAAAGALRPGWRLRRLALVAVGLVGAAIAAKTVEAADLIEPVRGVDRVPPAVPAFVQVCGWVGFAAAVAVAIAPIRIARRASMAWPALAALPFVLALAVWLVVALTAEDLPGATEPHAAIAGSVVAVVFGIGFWSSLLFFWEAAIGARAARDVTAPLAMAIRKSSTLALLIAGKLGWVFLGFAGLLPAVLGGDATRWETSRSDGVLAWVLAGLFAAAAVAWLVASARRPVVDAGVGWAVGGVIVALQLVVLVAAIGLFGTAIFAIAPASKGQDFFARMADPSVDQIVIAQVTVVFLALALGLLLAWARRPVSAGVAFLVVFGAWAFPRALDIAIDEAGGNPPLFLRVEIVTLDVAITVAIALVVVVSLLGRNLPIDVPLLTLAVLAGAVIAYGGALVDGVLGTTGFYLAFVFPVAYQFLFAAQALNRSDGERSTRILEAVGLAAALMTIVAVQITAGAIGPDELSVGALAQLLLAVPLTAVFVAAWRRPRPELTANDPNAAPRDQRGEAI